MQELPCFNLNRFWLISYNDHGIMAWRSFGADICRMTEAVELRHSEQLAECPCL